MGLRMKNLNIFGIHGKIVFLGGRSQKTPILRGELRKKERLGHFADLRRGSLARKRRVVFLRGRGVDTTMYTMRCYCWSDRD